MSASELAIDRVAIAIHGVSQEIAESAASGLAAELARRIDALTLGATPLAALDLPSIVLAPLTVPAHTDAAALRTLIADTLIGQVLEMHGRAGPDAAAAPETH